MITTSIGLVKYFVVKESTNFLSSSHVVSFRYKGTMTENRGEGFSSRWLREKWERRKGQGEMWVSWGEVLKSCTRKETLGYNLGLYLKGNSNSLYLLDRPQEYINVPLTVGRDTRDKDPTGRTHQVLYVRKAPGRVVKSSDGWVWL